MQQDNVPFQNVDRKRLRLSKGLAEKILLLATCVALGFAGGVIGSRSNSTLKTNTPQAQQEIIASESQLISKIAKDVSPSVVSVNVTGVTTTQGFFGPTQSEEQSAGTGVIISEDGVVITNRHVVPAGTEKVSVTLSDGTKLSDVEVIGRTSDTDTLDIAFLKIKDKKARR